VDSKGANKNVEECREDMEERIILYEIERSIEWNQGA